MAREQRHWMHLCAYMRLRARSSEKATRTSELHVVRLFQARIAASGTSWLRRATVCQPDGATREWRHSMQLCAYMRFHARSSEKSTRTSELHAVRLFQARIAASASSCALRRDAPQSVSWTARAAPSICTRTSTHVRARDDLFGAQRNLQRTRAETLTSQDFGLGCRNADQRCAQSGAAKERRKRKSIGRC